MLLNHSMFLLLEKQICLNPLKSGRVVKSCSQLWTTSSLLESLNPLESGRVVKLSYHLGSVKTEAIVLIPLNRVVLLNNTTAMFQST